MISDAIKASGSVDRTQFEKALRSAELIDASGEKIHFDENGRNTLNTVYIVQAVAFDDKRLATFALRDTIRFDLTEVPDLELSKARK
jgi:ABC-type branched-subunit amino acid transport system substrate-binding protein